VAKKSKLPFVVQPRLKSITERIGTEESGQIEIERKGYLTVAEKSIVQNAISDDSAMKNVYLVASKISRETSRDYAEVMADLGTQPRPDYMSPYEAEVNSCLVEMIAYQERLRVIVATSLLICRIDVSWSVEDTIQLHPDLITALNSLYEDEDRKSLEALEAAAEKEKSGEVKEKK